MGGRNLYETHGTFLVHSICLDFTLAFDFKRYSEFFGKFISYAKKPTKLYFSV